MSLFADIGIVLVAAATIGTLSYFFRQPLVLAYILAGILIGPYGFGLITDTEFIHVVGGIGIMLMLFLVGIETNIEKIRGLGAVAVAIGMGQIIFTGLAGFLIAQLFHFGTVASLYIALCLTLSSTVIAVKLLSDQKSLNSLYGKIVVGILIVQDFVAILSLVFLNSFRDVEGSVLINFGILLFKGVILSTITLFLLKRPLTWIYNHIASSVELLILFSLSWCFVIALISEYFGFSREMGAFIAGLSLANLPYALEISTKMKILRDFFITTFFVTLGAGMVFASVTNLIVPFLVLSLFVIIGNPIIVFVIMRLTGFDKRSSFFAGLSIAQISEFSFILITLGAVLNHVDNTIVSLVSMIAILTISVSSYMISFNQKLFDVLKKFLDIFPSHKSKYSSHAHIKEKLFDHIIMLGCGSGGQQLLDTLEKTGKKFIVVDHDPDVIRDLDARGINCIFGDVEDEEIFDELNIAEADLIISLLPNIEDNFILLHHLKSIKGKHHPIYIATVNTGREGFSLFSHGADYVVVKSFLEADHIQQIQRSLFHIEKAIDETKGAIPHPTALKGMEKHLLQDKEYAQLVHNLSKLRLAEIQKQRTQ